MPASITMRETSLWTNRRCLIICCVVSIANMQYGFDSAAVGSLQAMPGFLRVFGYEDPTSPIGYGIDSTVQRLISSLLTLGSFVSSLSAGYFAGFFGRRQGLWLACALNAIACGIQIGTDSAGVLYLGRVLLGFANGFLVTFSNVYTSEVAPAHLRGVMTALFAYWVQIGSILGSVVVNSTKNRMDKLSYRIPIACLYIVPTILGIGLFFVPESPRWLLHKGRNEQARQSLEQLRRGAVTSDELELEWLEMNKGVEEELKLAQSLPFMDMFKGHDLRRTLLCYGVIASQTASGVWFLIAYSTYFLSIAGITKAFEYSIMNTCLGFVGVNIGMYAIQHWVGRRTILIFGAVTCGLCELATGIAASVGGTSEEAGKAIVAFTALFLFFYLAGVGAASFPVATEVVSSRLRAWTIGTATSLGYFLAWLVSYFTPYFINPEELNWGAKYGYIWAASNFICVIFFYFCIPEMKGRSLEELDEIFEAGVPARKFKQYECRIVQEAKHELNAQHGVVPEKQEGTFVQSIEKAA